MELKLLVMLSDESLPPTLPDDGILILPWTSVKTIGVCDDTISFCTLQGLGIGSCTHKGAALINRVVGHPSPHIQTLKELSLGQWYLDTYRLVQWLWRGILLRSHHHFGLSLASAAYPHHRENAVEGRKWRKHCSLAQSSELLPVSGPDISWVSGGLTWLGR